VTGQPIRLSSADMAGGPSFVVPESHEPLIDAFFGPESVNAFLAWAATNGYSDVIFTTNRRITYRKYRKTYVSRQNSLTESQVDTVAATLISEGASVRALTAKPTDSAYATPKDADTGARHRFRVNLTAVQAHDSDNSIAIVCRSIPGKPWEYSRHNVDAALEAALFPDIGLSIVSGPMGSGKTTLTASIIRKITEETQKYIVTYEDPCEFDFSLLNSAIPVAQTQIGRGVESFSDALGNVTRRSADVIYWGESRDPDSIRSLTVACDLGAAVYTTAHANDVAETIPRLVRMFPSDKRDGMQAALVSTTSSIIFQRLIPAKNGGVIPFRTHLVLTDNFKGRVIDLELGALARETLKEQISQNSDPITIANKLWTSELIDRVCYSNLMTDLSSAHEQL